MAGYPRVLGGGYVAGHYPGTGIYGVDPMTGAMVPVHPHAALPVHPAPHPAIHSPPWRPMIAPGSPPLGEGHVPLPLTAETFGGTWGTSVGGAGSGTVITFSGRPQKPFKPARLIVDKTILNTGGTANGKVRGQAFVGTDLQQGELGFMNLEVIGAGTSFDTWLSFKQAEPGVWIRVQATLTAFPSGTTDFVTVTIDCLGHYLH